MSNAALTTMILGALMSFTGQASAQDVIDLEVINTDPPPVAVSTTPIADFIATTAPALALDPQDQRPVAIEYSDAHETRAKIHKYASWATLPLMGAEFALGEKLYNDTNSETDSLRGVHGAVGAGLIGLFGVNSVTGLWNLLESNQAPGRTKRLVHGIMMLAAEGGFVASAASAPGHSRNPLVAIDTNKATHRDIAFVSFGVGTAGYLLMLLTKN
jgi:hypothetical protein